MQVAATETNGN